MKSEDVLLLKSILERNKVCQLTKTQVKQQQKIMKLNDTVIKKGNVTE